jgi:sec-independent protein translocase protein TatC
MFYSYFLEIRNRLLLVIYGWIFTVFVSYYNKEILLFLLMKPNFFFKNHIPIYFIFTSITEIFSTYLKLIYFLTNQISLICFLYHVFLFLSPGLHYYEYKLLKRIFFICLLLFFFSIVILKKAVLPACWNFFLSYQNTIGNNSVNFYFEAKINEYLKFYINLYFMCSLCCQMFMIIIFIYLYIKSDLKLIKKFRKILYLLFIIFATIITPPDVITQLILGSSLIFIFEVLVFNVLFKNSFNLEAR